MTDKNDRKPSSGEASDQDSIEQKTPASVERKGGSEIENSSSGASDQGQSGGKSEASSEAEEQSPAEKDPPATSESDAKVSRQSGPRRSRGRPKSTSTARSGRSWLWPALSVLLVLVMIAAGYWVYEQYRAVAKEWQDVAQGQNMIRQQLGSLESRLEQTEQARQSLARELRNEQSQLEQMMIDTAQRLSRRQDLEADRWPLEEALALLRLAERRLQLDQNADVAIRLLDAADQVLAGLNQAAVLPVRRQIAQDRLALKSVDTPDLNGLYFRLEAVERTLAEQEWTPEQRVEPQAQTEPKPPWEAFKENLSSLVTITRLDTAHQAPPLLSDFAQWQQHGRLLAEQLQMALLARNQTLFDAALEQLIEHLSLMQQQLDLDSAIADLKDLRDVQLNPDLPDIHSSTAALEDYMARIDEQAPEDNESTATDAES